MLQQQVFKVEDSEKKDSLLEILSDKYCRTSKTALQSSANNGKTILVKFRHGLIGRRG